MDFNSYSNHIRNLFGERVQKISINAGFTCPNRDGISGVGGCSFCNGAAFVPAYANSTNSLLAQIENGISFHRKRNKKTDKYLAYLQSFSNTYAPVNILEKIYKEVLSHPDIVGIIISTRPDCIDDEKLDLIQQLSKNHYIKIEYGVESTYDETLRAINRGHDFAATIDAFEKTHNRNIPTAAHIIFGLPGESKEMIINQANTISKIKPESLKIHQLQIMKGTAMAEQYESNPDLFAKLDLKEYLDILIKFIERLNPDIAIERIASEVPKQYQFSKSNWGYVKYDYVLQLFKEMLKERNTYQGRLFQHTTVI